MKSQLKVDYKSRYNDGEFGEKEPLIRVELVRSEDPRDALLNEIFEKDEIFPPLAASRIKEENGERTFFIYKKSTKSLLCDLLSNVHLALAKYSGLDVHFCTSHDEYYFELASNYQVRSKGVSREIYFEGLQTYSNSPDADRNKYYMLYIEQVVKDFKDFEQIVKDYTTKGTDDKS